MTKKLKHEQYLEDVAEERRCREILEAGPPRVPVGGVFVIILLLLAVLLFGCATPQPKPKPIETYLSWGSVSFHHREQVSHFFTTLEPWQAANAIISYGSPSTKKELDTALAKLKKASVKSEEERREAYDICIEEAWSEEAWSTAPCAETYLKEPGNEISVTPAKHQWVIFFPVKQ